MFLPLGGFHRLTLNDMRNEMPLKSEISVFEVHKELSKWFASYLKIQVSNLWKSIWCNFLVWSKLL